MENILYKIKSNYEILDPAEKRVADYLIQNMASIPYLPIGVLAEKVHTSKTTIDRFCKKLDFRGYKDIKIEILRYISSDSSGFLSGVDLPQDFENMSLSDLLNFVLGVNVETLLEIKNITTLESIERAINIITKSKCIILVGVGSSAPVVLDLEQRLTRLGLNCCASTDPHFQITRSLSLSNNDSIIAVSYSGCTKDIYDCLKIAKKRGAKIVSITSFPNSPIAGISDCCLCSPTRKVPLPSESFASRISQLAIFDVICAGIYMNKKEKLKDFIKDVEVSMSSKRI
jgi:DNA-binding MurR/RpiR family transcriptional regulator